MVVDGAVRSYTPTIGEMAAMSNTLAAPRQSRRHGTEYRQPCTALDRAMKEAYGALADVAGRAVHSASHEIARAEPRAYKPWSKDAEVLITYLEHARTLPAADRMRLRLAVQRVLSTFTAGVMAHAVDDLPDDMTIHLIETQRQARLDEAQLAHARNPDCPATNERLLAAATDYYGVWDWLRLVPFRRLTMRRA